MRISKGTHIHALSYAKTAPTVEQHGNHTEVAEVRNHPQAQVGQGLYALQALSKDQQVRRCLGACAYPCACAYACMCMSIRFGVYVRVCLGVRLRMRI
jgi:hypothetical protein